VDQDARMRQGIALALGATSQQHRNHGRRLSHAASDYNQDTKGARRCGPSARAIARSRNTVRVPQAEFLNCDPQGGATGPSEGALGQFPPRTVSVGNFSSASCVAVAAAGHARRAGRDICAEDLSLRQCAEPIRQIRWDGPTLQRTFLVDTSSGKAKNGNSGPPRLRIGRTQPPAPDKRPTLAVP
jgi:hypothetical protein